MFKGLWFFVQFGWKTNKKYIIYNVLRQFIYALIPVLSVAMPKYIIDELLGLRRINLLFLYSGILVGYNLIASVLSNFLMLSAFTIRCEISIQFDRMMHKKLTDVDYQELESPGFLDMKEKANKFLYGDWKGFSFVLDSALNIIGQTFTLIGIATIIARMNIYIIVLFVVVILINAAVESWAKKNELSLSLEQAKYGRGSMYYNKLFEDFSYGKEIRLNVLGDWLLEREKIFYNKSTDFYRRMNRFSMKSGAFSSFATFLQQCTAYAYLIYKVINNAVGIGDFTMYIGAVTAFSGAMKQVMSSIVEIKAYGIYYDALQDYINIESKLRDNKHLPIPDGKHIIEFKNVYFRYYGQQEYALKNINIKLESGKKLSVIGENGAGKTTFVKLLTRIYDPSEGEILLDGVNIKEIDYDSYMRLFSTVFQDFKLFSFTLKENIALSFSETANDKDIEEIIKKVGLGERLLSLPNGVYSSVYKNFDENGFEPSGGEGQKIALARALYKNAPIVILDEPTAALDPRAEYEIYQHFNELVQGKTAVFISHRLSSAKFCDNIAVFKNGEITEYGMHDDLILRNGLYTELFEMQAKFYV